MMSTTASPSHIAEDVLGAFLRRHGVPRRVTLAALVRAVFGDVERVPRAEIHHDWAQPPSPGEAFLLLDRRLRGPELEWALATAIAWRALGRMPDARGLPGGVTVAEVAHAVLRRTRRGAPVRCGR